MRGIDIVEMKIIFLPIFGSFPACRKTRDIGHIAPYRISTMEKCDIFCLVNQQEKHPVLCDISPWYTAPAVPSNSR